MSMLNKSANKKGTLREQDPYLEREKTKYGYPLPSREHVIATLSKQGVPLDLSELYVLFSIRDDEIRDFDNRLKAMERAGQIIINRKGAVCIAGKLDLIKCTIQGHRDGYGFAIPENKIVSDIYLTERDMRQVLHGDEVMVRITGTDRRGRPEGSIVEILSRAVDQVIGRIYHQEGLFIVIPEDSRINQDILIDTNHTLAAKEGQVVMAKITTQPNIHCQPIGRVVEVLGDYAQAGMEIEIALRKHALPYFFNEEAINQAQQIPQQVSQKEISARVDVQHVPFVTIDGEDARDFDDAVYAEKEGDDWRLMVAIADVSHYVKPNDALDKAAYDRGTSVYFPRRVIPMLPEALSHGICSLNPHVSRLCVICDMHVLKEGNIQSYSFYPAVICSVARLTYDQVWHWIDTGAQHPHKKQIDTLYALFIQLSRARHQRGAIEFDSTETRMLFDDHGKIERIEPVQRNDAHRLIEECMLCANVCAANFIADHEHPVLYRIHEGPTPEKLDTLRQILAFAGLSLDGGDKPSPKDYAKLSDKIRSRPNKLMLQTSLLRSMQQAVYSPDNRGHFGLSYEKYLHFTSPIRRYPDLLVHRVIKMLLAGKHYQLAQWAAVGEHCSFTERRAEDASRDVEAWLKTYFMLDKVGEIFTGKISTVTSFGVFVLLDHIYVEGLVHISELGKDYFHYRPETLSIEGERSGKTYRLGDPITIRVASANIDSRKIDFVLVEPSTLPKKSHPLGMTKKTNSKPNIKK